MEQDHNTAAAAAAAAAVAAAADGVSLATESNDEETIQFASDDMMAASEPYVDDVITAPKRPSFLGALRGKNSDTDAHKAPYSNPENHADGVITATKRPSFLGALRGKNSESETNKPSNGSIITSEASRDSESEGSTPSRGAKGRVPVARVGRLVSVLSSGVSSASHAAMSAASATASVTVSAASSTASAASSIVRIPKVPARQISYPDKNQAPTTTISDDAESQQGLSQPCTSDAPTETMQSPQMSSQQSSETSSQLPSQTPLAESSSDPPSTNPFAPNAVPTGSGVSSAQESLNNSQRGSALGSVNASSHSVDPEHSDIIQRLGYNDAFTNIRDTAFAKFDEIQDKCDANYVVGLSLEKFVIDMKQRGCSVQWADAAYRTIVKGEDFMSKQEYLIALCALESNVNMLNNETWYEIRKKIMFCYYDKGNKGHLSREDFYDLLAEASISDEEPQFFCIMNQYWKDSMQENSEFKTHDITRLQQETAEAKTKLAIKQQENDELHHAYIQLEKQLCQMKLDMAKMQADDDEVDDEEERKYNQDDLQVYYGV